MGSVGLTFGSATSGTGFDVASTVKQILAAQTAIESPWKDQLASAQAQDAAFTSLGTQLSTLTTSTQALTDFTGVLAQKLGSSSNNNVLTLTAASSQATSGSHTIAVSQLAQTSSNYFDKVTNATDTLSGNVSIQVGSGASTPITIDSTNNTLTSLATAINHAGLGVTATVISDSTGSQLSIVSSTNGAAGQLTLGGTLTDATSSTTLASNVGQLGKDANLTIDGVALTSASNTVTNALPGVTFQLLSTSSAASPVNVQITNDNNSITTALNSFVTAYNAVSKSILAQEGNDAAGKAQPLYGNPLLAQVQGQLTLALTGGAASGSISNLNQLGIAANADGSLSLNVAQLQTALNNHFADVTGFLQNINSFGQTFSTALNNVGVQSPTGQIAQALQANTVIEKSFTDSISNQDARIAANKITLTNELNAANQILQGIPSQLNSVNEIYSAITGYSKTTG